MKQTVKCRCGWEGSVDDGAAGQPVRCLICGEPLPLPETPSSLQSGASSQTFPGAPAVTGQPAEGSSMPNDFPAIPGRTTSEQLNAAWKTAVKYLARVGRPIWQFIRQTARFYWDNRQTLKGGTRLWLSEFFPSLVSAEQIRREIHLPLEDQEHLHSKDGIWQLEFPAVCVMCGGKASGDWIEESRSVLDPWNLLLFPLAGLIVGTILGWWNESRLWLVALLLAGFAVGYALRRKEHFLLRFRRCERHLDMLRYPELSVMHGDLVVRVGAREVKLAFQRQPNEFTPPAEAVPIAETCPPAPPETIALAESVPEESRIVQEGHARRLAGAEDEAGESHTPIT